MHSIALFVLLLSTLDAGNALSMRQLSTDPTPNKVKVELFYETLCPFCRHFMSTSLNMVLEDEELSERIDLHLYPFGNADVEKITDVSKGYRYWHQDEIDKGFEYVIACQHGCDECFGNTLQACALKHLDNTTSSSFIVCMESRDDVSLEWASDDCAEKFGVDLDPIRDCVQGTEGNLAMVDLGTYTNSLKSPAGPKEYVPWVVMDGKHSEESEIDGDEGNSGHFLQQLCGKLDDPKPNKCNNVKVVSQASMLSTNYTMPSLKRDQQRRPFASVFGCKPSALERKK